MSSAKRLAQNSMFMYIRMGVLMLVSFYTSRVVLEKLGVEDFGIYNLVGSVVGMFSSLRTIFAASTQRFLNYEMGKGNYTKLNTIFNNSLIVNSFISIIFILLVESIGIWFINNKINIELDRLIAAKWVFQFSIFSAVIGIMTTTFDAEIIAHEKMNFFAFLSIGEGILKLGIVFLLSIFNLDRLILYSVLMLNISFFVFIANWLYCRLKFDECRVRFVYDKHILKDMTKFAGWNFLGTNAYIFMQSGINMILNIFGGPIVNAARGIAYQVSGAINQFISNVVIVVNPYCIKTYAEGNLSKTFSAIFFTSKILFLIQYLIMIPILFLTSQLINLWLGKIPEYSVIFLQLTLLYLLIRTLHFGIDTLFKANGKLKHYQICEGTILLMPLVFSYLALYNGFDYYIVFVLMIFFDIVNLLCIVLIASKQIGLPIKAYFKKVLIPCLFFTLFIIIILALINSINLSVINRLLLATLIDIVSVTCFYFFALKKEEKNLILSFIKRK